MHTYIKTISQLRKHIGEIVVCYYYEHSLDTNREGWHPEEGKVEFMWMFKLLDDGENYRRYGSRELIRHKTLYGLNYICMVNNTTYEYPIVDNITPHIMYHSDGDRFDLLQPQESSAQSYMRLATKEEIKIYNELTRKRKILGHD
jgi:hypothetical protein